MKDTIKSEKGFSVCHIQEYSERGEIVILKEGEKALFSALLVEMYEYEHDKVYNECFKQFEVFTTRKGNQFIYWGDLETGADYLTKVEADQ